MDTHEDSDPSVPPNETWWILSCLPYCPSQEDILREYKYLYAGPALPFPEDEDEEEAEPFYLDDSDFGKIPTIIRNRDPQALFNIRLSSNLPFVSEEDDDTEIYNCPEIRDSDEAKSALNFMTLHTRKRARESVKKPAPKLKNLTRMLNLPQELVLQAINRSFRTFLSSPPSNPIWKRSFASSIGPSAPACPDDVDGWEWARLLFGAPKCDDCGEQRNSIAPDAALRKRLCNSCLCARDEGMPIHAIEQMSLVNDLILKTLDQCVPPNTDYTDPDHYVQADFDAVLEECVRLQVNVDTGIDGAELAMEEYKTTRRAYVATQLAHVRECNAWIIELHQHFRAEVERIFDNQLKLIGKRLRREGFAEVDIADADWELRTVLNGECHSRYTDFNEAIVRYTSLTRRNWQTIREPYRAIVQTHADKRRKQERETLVNNLISEHRKTTTPITARIWPPNEAFLTLAPFDGIINLEPTYEGKDPSVLEEALNRGKSLIPSFVNRWVSEINEHAMNELSKPVQKTRIQSADVDPLELAINVFKCKGCSRGKCLMGWEEVALHMHCHPEGDVSKKIEWNYDGFRGVCVLLRELGLDRFKTTAREMDERDDRFVCLSCPNVSRREARNWREAVAHRVAHPKEKNTWKVLPSRLTAMIKKREGYPAYSENYWACNHCHIHLHPLERVSRADAARHVVDEHKIRPPKEQIDYFFFPKADESPLRRKLFSVQDEALFLCLNKCGNQRLMNEGGIKMHQRDKHQLPESVPDRDYVCVWEGVPATKEGGEGTAQLED
ncbi:hypothetical protein PQX77_013802 [Marasmius sp. AFHP31]|nr:hypothetical protein PQX77_013802 [Marasmius sp. AFHP31]